MRVDGVAVSRIARAVCASRRKMRRVTNLAAIAGRGFALTHLESQQKWVCFRLREEARIERWVALPVVIEWPSRVVLVVDRLGVQGVVNGVSFAEVDRLVQLRVLALATLLPCACGVSLMRVRLVTLALYQRHSRLGALLAIRDSVLLPLLAA